MDIIKNFQDVYPSTFNVTSSKLYVGPVLPAAPQTYSANLPEPQEGLHHKVLTPPVQIYHTCLVLVSTAHWQAGGS